MMDKFVLKFLWLDKSIAVCLDQKISVDRSIPLTEYYFWPQKDAWEEMKNYIEENNWIIQKDAVILLNKITEVINFWQEASLSQKKDFQKLEEKFPDCLFIGHNH
uniref:putative ribosomal protein PSRP-3/Ycf65 n=1 Tax=Euglena deses TaxID=66845 RepID=UPI0023AB3038|nr:putative ribosomal protein PSRP-3/Ycf65 [Euglena deses]WCH63390.1 putative ribosomal protein PSRP-3/Ycf65 [Euglena deses]